MAKYIDIEKLKKGGWSLIRYERLKYGELKVERQELAEVPVADVQEVRHGRWIKQGAVLHRCSCCGLVIDDYYPPSIATTNRYCNRCGARMDGEKE